jgi:hypothetical protein
MLQWPHRIVVPLGVNVDTRWVFFILLLQWSTDPRFPACVCYATGKLVHIKLQLESCLELTSLQWALACLCRGILQWHVLLWTKFCYEPRLDKDRIETRYTDKDETIAWDVNFRNIWYALPVISRSKRTTLKRRCNSPNKLYEFTNRKKVV